MKKRIYMRFAEDRRAQRGFRIDASAKAQAPPLTNARGVPLQTVRFAVELEIPDSLLRPAEWPVVKITMSEGAVDLIALEEVVEVTPSQEA